jgi:hypothetical protein
MMKKLLVLLMSLLMLVFVGNVSATVLTFDDLPDIALPTEAPIGTYGGLTWSPYFAYGDGADMNSYLGISESGYSNGTVSQNHIAFNSYQSAVSVSDGVFDFNGAYLTGAWNDGLDITVEGWLSGSKIYGNTVTVDSTAPTWFDFNYMGIDKLVFSSVGGTDHGYGGNGTFFVMDNFTFDQSVPEPSTCLLLVSGLVGIGLLRRRFKN